MSRKITVTVEKCVGCHTCELACAIEHSEAKDIERMMLAGEKPGYRIHVETYGPRSIPISCQHCEEAACVLACPTGVMAMSPTGKSAFKCDLCVARLARGLQTACVSSCPTRALHLEDEGAANREKRKLAVARLAEAQAAGAREEL
jgi:carbon-monoxide dehydrogenase iron sulfur subunit